MRVEKDFEELLELFNRHKVKYCIIGAFAVAFYAKPRYTKDIDILVEPTVENAVKIKKALENFGFKSLNLTVQDFSEEGRVIQLGYEPVRVDLITSIKGCSFEKVWRCRVKGKYGKQNVFFIGFNELVKSKKFANRGQDRIDIDILTAKAKNKKRRS